MSFVTRRALSTLIPPKGSIGLTEFDQTQAIGAAPDAIRMQRVVSFYEKLPRGAAPEVKAKGIIGRYQAKHFGKNPSVKPIIHAIVFLVTIGYAQNYYFHLPQFGAKPNLAPSSQVSRLPSTSPNPSAAVTPGTSKPHLTTQLTHLSLLVTLLPISSPRLSDRARNPGRFAPERRSASLPATSPLLLPRLEPEIKSLSYFRRPPRPASDETTARLGGETLHKGFLRLPHERRIPRRMMATEAAVDKAADATASQSQPAPDAQNVDPVRSNLNGSAGNDDIENKHITSVEDHLNSADASASGGSDTEASRADGRSKDGDRGHGRTGSSVKKPATFKAVSVNKTFLAAKANAGSTTTKTADKPPTGSSTPPTSSATLSSSRPRLIAKTGSSTRDSSPRFSGGANGGKPGAAPDASAVWNKNRPAPPPEPKKFTDEELKKYGIHMASRLNEDDAQGQNKWADIDDDDDDWAPEAITWGDGTKTTLPHPDEHPPPGSDNGSVASKGKSFEKPRSPAPPISVSSPLAKSSNLAQGKGLVLKSGSQEKPTLVAKPPAPPPPVKSPWATLPPVEKSSPIPEQAQLARTSSREPPHFKGMTPPPPKEIAADDFNRSAWRDGPSHGNRELYNSHSGRYEPVLDNRRGSMRMEQHPKHPSLLQRPPPSDYPAEPSGAFQTSRVSQDAPFARRRGSSNVSGGSGSFMRMNKGNDGPMPPPELLGARRTSFAGSVDSPVSPNLSVSTHGPPRQAGWMQRASPRAAFATPHQAGPPLEPIPGPPPPLPPVVDEVEYQKKLMRERVELARKRRQEEEAREEAERRERIQKKLDAMGPAPEKKTDKKEVPAKSDDASQPTQIQQRDASESPTESQEGEKSATVLSARQQAPELDAKGGSPNHAHPSAAAPRRVSHSQEAKPADLWGAAAASRQERVASSWGAGSQPQSRNVWGSPNNDRGLGNGTFNPDLGRLPAASQGSKGPAPIAPPGAARQPSQGRSQPPAPIGSGPSRYGPPGPHITPGPDVASKWVAAVSDNDKKLSAARLAERVERERQLSERGLSIEDAQPTIKDTWRPVHAPGDGTRRPVEPHGQPEPQTHPARPWRTPGEETKAAPSREELAAPGNAGVLGAGGSSILSQTGKGAASQGRTSRFFPMKDSRDGGSHAEPSRSKSPTPPPPTMEGHPAYEGDVMRPHVSLPKPHPVVKLPPPMAASQAPPARPQFGWANPPPFKDPTRPPVSPHRAPLTAGEATQEKWQNRINSLLNGARSPPQRSIGVDPASKSALDHHVTHHDSATVSLPGAGAPPQAIKGRSSPFTKPMAEECFEEQEMGSLPQIRLPHKAPEAAWQPALAQNKPLPKKFAVQPAVMEPYYFPADVVGGGNAMKIQFPGMTEPKIVTIPFSATRGGRGSHLRSGPRHRGSGHERRGGKRDVSSSRGEHPTTSSSRGGRGGYRARGSDNWSRGSGNPASLST
ncbi:hypothetical protein FALBO_9146 [Fusarium albosuccineum]|uniref:ATP synthase subunit f, mitochondrial n=1 Tax=Fusarium albosuccineum TaxID=1237068 RepID=A0A8H4P9A1_9HYPO|nr:hypothetical protein FALBO_9146 [Fusarium albosuccineum]